MFGYVNSQLLLWKSRYDSVYLTYSKKLTGSQLSLPHGIKKNKLMSMIGPIQSRSKPMSLSTKNN